MYHDFVGREIEDREGENMRHDWREERQVSRNAIMEAWARNQGFYDIEELLNGWPYMARVERYMQVIFQCVSCRREIIEPYPRQDPDFLAWQKCCHWCGEEVIAARVIPFTMWRQFRSLSFNVHGHCWQCGKVASPFYHLTFTSGLTAQLCRKHRIAYARHIARMNALAPVKQAAIENMAKHWYKWPGPQGDDVYTLASNSEEAFRRFVRENAGEDSNVSVDLATSQEIEVRKLDNWIF